MLHLRTHAQYFALLWRGIADPDARGFAHHNSFHMPQPLAATVVACLAIKTLPLFMRARACTVCDCDRRMRTAASAVPAAAVNCRRQARGEGLSSASTMISSHQSCSVMGSVTLTLTGTALGLSASTGTSSCRPSACVGFPLLNCSRSFLNSAGLGARGPTSV